MKKIFSIMFLLLSISLFSQNIQYGFSLGDFSVYTDMSDGEIQLELFSFRVLESNTGLGLTTYVWPVFSNNISENSDIIFGNNDLLSVEFNWEPFYKEELFWGAGLYFRVDNYLPSGNEFSWSTGARFDFRYNFNEFIYPLVSLETGYGLDRGFYWGVKIDPVILLAMFGMSIGSQESTQYRKDNNPEGFYPNGDPWSGLPETD
jgi:hypothetical protein